MGQPSLIHLENLTKYYKSTRALDQVTLDIGPGVTGLLGPNGAGKSTLIKLLLGLVKISSGTGTVLGYDLQRQPRKIRSLVGYMVEDDSYIPGMSGVETVRFAARLSGLPSIEGLRRAHEILDFCGMGQERYRDVETYSTGMRQKIKFAQAIVHDPPLLVLDEPTSGLDPEEREKMLRRIRVLAGRAGKAVVISTHILPDVQTVCDSVIILVNGRVRLVETLEVLSRPSSPAYEIRVIGSPEQFVERIKRAGVDAKLQLNGTISMTTTSDDIRQHVWTWASETGIGIRTFRPARNSLEKIFVDAVKENTHAHS